MRTITKGTRMGLVKRSLMLISAAALAGTALLSSSALTANAATGPRVPKAPGDVQCVFRASVGTLCVVEENNGYNVGFNSNISDPSVDFNLITSSGTYGDQGAFPTSPGQTNTYFFAVGYKGSAQACLYSRDFRFAPLCTLALFG